MLYPLTNASLTQLHTVSVVIPTVLRPALERAVRSVFEQQIDGTLQILIGIDAIEGDDAILNALSRLCPPHVRIDILQPGYSTALNRGGLYPSRAGGALRTILSYLAHSVYVAYLDDDNWWSPRHLSSLLTAIGGADWAFSGRWFVEAETGEAICVDQWESVGVEAGVYASTHGGFVDTSSLMLNKLACHDVLPHWSRAAFPDGSGEDRLVFDALKTRRAARTGQATSFYLAKADDAMAANRLQYFRENGVVLPSQRQIQVTTLATAMARLGQQTICMPGDGPEASAAPDPLLTTLIGHLKPQEVIALVPDRSTLWHDFACACHQNGLTPVAAVFDPFGGLERLDGHVLAVDLVLMHFLSETMLPDVIDRVWRLLRGGGIVLGEGYAAPAAPLGLFLTRFAAEHRAELLPASLPGKPRWVLQKG